MNKMILVTGPARSGKSEWAETLAMDSGKPVVYIATATENPNDPEWQQRILLHQQRRPQNWITLSVPEELTAALMTANHDTCLLIDSLGTWVANLLWQDEGMWQQTTAEFLEKVQLIAAQIVFVGEETGWGVVPAYPVGRQFRDRLGSLIRQLGAICDTVYLVTGGYVLNLSILGSPLPKPKS
jgi:adenosylcobinamide kinase/adenosylcobinamide-phosphate guanylyltransferase